MRKLKDIKLKERSTVTEKINKTLKVQEGSTSAVEAAGGRSRG